MTRPRHRPPLFLAVAILWSGPALAADCPPPGLGRSPPPVEFTLSIPDPVERHTLDRKEITGLAGNDAQVGIHNPGLTRSRTEFRVRPRFQLASFDDKQVCVILQKVDASWKMTELTVYLAREYPEGSCQYRETRAHEDEHVRINQYTMRRFAPVLEARLRKTAAALAARWDKKGGRDVMEAMTQELKAAGAAVLSEFQAELRKGHAAIDTPESYRAVARKCDRW
mgnify:CR=1 FL=1